MRNFTISSHSVYKRNRVLHIECDLIINVLWLAYVTHIFIVSSRQRVTLKRKKKKYVYIYLIESRKISEKMNSLPSSTNGEVSGIVVYNEENPCNNIRSKSDEERCHASDSHSEKCDILPENLEKSSCDVTPVDDESISVSATPSNMSERTIADETSTGSRPANASMTDSGDDKTCDDSDGKSKMAASGVAFTIDFNEGKSMDSQKYKEIVLRFQSRQQKQQQQRRHRRGMSLSKLDDTRKSSSSLNNSGRCSPVIDDLKPVARKPPIKVERLRTEVDVPATNTTQQTTDDKAAAMTKVVMRRRPLQKFDTGKDSPKRHSWSPLSSLNYETVPQLVRTVPADEQPKQMERTTVFQPKSTTLQRALEQTSSQRQKDTQESLRATAKAAVKSFENHVAVVTDPLEYVRQSDESMSDAGTYTLDGDNYTEEEKERMSIDKLAQKTQLAELNNNRKYMNLQMQSQAEISVGNSATQEKCVSGVGAKKVLEVNDNESGPGGTSCNASKTSKISYLGRLKSRVKIIGDRTFHKSKSPTPNYRVKSADVASKVTDITPDHGTFTSITACGVLNKYVQPESVSEKRESKVAHHRKNSLSKLQIDSSEYIQSKYNIDQKLSYTDYEKAKQCEYQLNIFSNARSYAATNSDDEQSDAAEDEDVSIKTAPTKNDWIQEWAKNARRRNTAMAVAGSSVTQKLNKVHARYQPMTQSYDDTNEFGDDSHGEDGMSHFYFSSNRNMQHFDTSPEHDAKRQSLSSLRPPISPSKIPSPVHTRLRGRSSSANRNFPNSNADLDNFETRAYLEKTAAAISSLQEIQRQNNSPRSPSSPKQFTPSTGLSSCNTYEKSIDARLHKRNLSLDVKHVARKLHDYSTAATHYDTDSALDAQIQERQRLQHTRQHSHDIRMIQNSSKRSSIDQAMLAQQPLHHHLNIVEHTALPHKHSDDKHVRRRSSVGGDGGNDSATTGSPIRRSSSFCQRNQVNSSRNVTKKPAVTARRVHHQSTSPGNALQKSASSSSFKKTLSAACTVNRQQMDDTLHDFYVKDEDDSKHFDDDEYNFMYSSDDSEGDAINTNNKHETDVATRSPLSHTRYNKAFLMRMEQNKQIAADGSTGGLVSKGLQACPNTPERQRRSFNPRGSFRDRTSMPRDSSLSRMKQDIPNLQTTKHSLMQTASKDSNSSSTGSGSANKTRVLPKYMDISKYKPTQGQNFLKRDESKSTLINRSEIRKSPSAIGLSKADTTRQSGRVKSAGAKTSAPITTKGRFIFTAFNITNVLFFFFVFPKF